MRYSSTALVLAAAIITRVAAGPAVHQRHGQFHEKRDLALLDVEAQLEERDEVTTTIHVTKTVYYTWGEPTPEPAPTPPATTTTPPPPPPVSSSALLPPPSPPVEDKPKPPAAATLSDGDASKLTSLGFQATGKNAKSSSEGGTWIGTDGPYTNEFTNKAGVDLILVIWGPHASWVNVKPPLITLSLAKGASVTISFADGESGAFAAVYPDTTLSMGQIKNTWGEYTFTYQGVVDVSREVYTKGHDLSIVGPKCTTDMNTCVFVCPDLSQDSCMYGYKLINCEGSGAQSGYDPLMAGASGGCGWDSHTAALKTTFS